MGSGLIASYLVAHWIWKSALTLPEALISTIADLKLGIVAGSYRSETEISQGVVKRILDVLGWPVFDMRVVAPEFMIGSRKVDYALCHPPGNPSVLLEVKALGKADGKGEKQLFEYCFHEGVPIAVLSDGRVWSFYFPAGQGSYEERRFAHIDLIADDPSECCRTLGAYLRVDDVRSGEARKRAQRDYEEARRRRVAESKYGSVWQRLLSGPESLLLDLFLEEVEQATSIRPDRERAATFIRAQVSATGGLPVEKKKAARKKRTKSDGQGIHSVTFGGQTETFKTGAAAMGAVFTNLASRDPGFCERFAQQFHGRVRRYVAKSKAALYPGTPQFEKYSISLPGGWWLATHCGNREKKKRIRKACTVAGLEFGRDLKIHIPTGSRVRNA